MNDDYYRLSLELHREHKGKLAVTSKVPLDTTHDLSLAYTPGVAEPCREIEKDPEAAYDYTWKSNSVAVITDGTAVLGLGNIGGLAGLPVMEGKCLLFKHFADVDAVPICLATQDVDEIVQTIVNIAPTFGGINLEDIAAPACFEVERRLKEQLTIPVFHDDQHGTAIVVVAGMINALKVVGKKIEDVRMVMSGAGAGGMAIAELLMEEGARDIILCDSKGALVPGRPELMNRYKVAMAEKSNPQRLSGSLAEVMSGADVFIGVSKAGVVTRDMVASMADQAIVFAMANPVPEIMPDQAKAGGAAVIATGRSDFPNQINNILAFPGIFRGTFDAGAREITRKMNLAAAHALAMLVPHPTADKIIPGPFEDGVAHTVAEAVKGAV